MEIFYYFFMPHTLCADIAVSSSFLLTINLNVVMNKSRWWRAYLNDEKKNSKFMDLCVKKRKKIWVSTWHSYVASSIFCADAIFSRQLFGYWKDGSYLSSPEYLCFPTVSSSNPFSLRRIQVTCEYTSVIQCERKWS